MYTPVIELIDSKDSIKKRITLELQNTVEDAAKERDLYILRNLNKHDYLSCHLTKR